MSFTLGNCEKTPSKMNIRESLSRLFKIQEKTWGKKNNVFSFNLRTVFYQKVQPFLNSRIAWLRIFLRVTDDERKVKGLVNVS